MLSCSARLSPSLSPSLSRFPRAQELTRVCVLSDFTMIVAWSLKEMARYLETFKSYEKRPPTAIQERVDTAFVPRVTETLTVVRSVNKTDVMTLLGA